MEQRRKQGKPRWDGWVARLVETQLALSRLATSVEAPAAEARWPARLIHAGALLIGVSAAVLVTWLRRRL